MEVDIRTSGGVPLPSNQKLDYSLERCLLTSLREKLHYEYIGDNLGDNILGICVSKSGMKNLKGGDY
ncbi:MAG: hypothetical protein ACFFDT_18595 [Candidatus Hodarchaeota archaeon]